MAIPATAEVRLTTAQKRVQAVQLRRAGHTLEQIGTQLGVSRSQAHRYIVQAMKAYRDTMVGDTALLVAQEVERWDRLQAAWWAKAIAGNRDAAAIVSKCIMERSKLLGLIAPPGAAPVFTPPPADSGPNGGGPNAASPDGWNQSGGSGGPPKALSEAMGILDDARARAADGVDPADSAEPTDDA